MPNVFFYFLPYLCFFKQTISTTVSLYFSIRRFHLTNLYRKLILTLTINIDTIRCMR